MLYRAGLISFPDYVATVNEKLRKYETGEGTEVTLQDFIRRHSENNSVLNQLDARRGAVLAIWTDAMIRRNARDRSSLDSLMFDLVGQNTAYARHRDGKPMALTNRRVFRAVSKYLSHDSRNTLGHYVEQGGSIRVPETALGPCVQSQTEAEVRFDLGFDRRSTLNQPHIAFGVEPDSEAYKEGLRNGQRLAGWSFDFGDATKEVRLRIVTDHGEQVLNYYPPGNQVQVQQFSLDANKYSLNQGVCTAFLASR